MSCLPVGSWPARLRRRRPESCSAGAGLRRPRSGGRVQGPRSGGAGPAALPALRGPAATGPEVVADDVLAQRRRIGSEPPPAVALRQCLDEAEEPRFVV